MKTTIILSTFMVLSIALSGCDDRKAILVYEDGARPIAITVIIHSDYRAAEKLLGTNAGNSYADIFKSPPRYTWVLCDNMDKMYAKLPFSAFLKGDVEVKETLVADVSNKDLLCYIEREWSGRFFRSPTVKFRPNESQSGINVTYRTVIDANGEKRPDIYLQYIQ